MEQILMAVTVGGGRGFLVKIDNFVPISMKGY